MKDAILEIEPLGPSPSPWKTLDPFLFCVHHVDHYPAATDEMGPAVSLEGRQIGQDFANRDGWNMYHGSVVPGFPQHPHRGFETVTIVRRGLIDHADSLGAAARYGHGDVQWLTAGRGISHSEMFPLVDRDGPNPTELFQIWLNLPRASKRAEPHFSIFWQEEIPVHVHTDDAGKKTEVTVVAGDLGDDRALAPPPASWAARPDADVAIWTIRMEPGATWTLPPAKAGSNRALFFFDGDSLRVAGREIPGRQAISLQPDVAVPLEAGDRQVSLLLLQGRPIAEPVVQYGPFVMNAQEEILQTMREYQITRFGGWPWPKDDPVHPREEGRFARMADGTILRPT